MGIIGNPEIVQPFVKGYFDSPTLSSICAGGDSNCGQFERKIYVNGPK